MTVRDLGTGRGRVPHTKVGRQEAHATSKSYNGPRRRPATVSPPAIAIVSGTNSGHGDPERGVPVGFAVGAFTNINQTSEQTISVEKTFLRVI